MVLIHQTSSWRRSRTAPRRVSEEGPPLGVVAPVWSLEAVELNERGAILEALGELPGPASLVRVQKLAAARAVHPDRSRFSSDAHSGPTLPDRHRLAKEVEEGISIPIDEEDLLASVAAGGDMIQSAFVLHAQRTGHDGKD